MRTFAVLAVLLGVALQVADINGYAAGAPEAACKDMIPQHHVDPQPLSTTPYKITAVKKADGSATVEITGSKTFKGYFVQGRDASGKPVGSFDAAPGVTLVNCEGKATGATHSGPEDKTSITLSWKPGTTKGQIKFRATVAENGGTFWVGQESQPLTF